MRVCNSLIAFIVASALLSCIQATVTFTGVNLAGAEFDSTAVWPTTADMDYFASKGMNIFRIPFKWERLQTSLGGNFDTTYLNQLDSVVNYATNTKKVYVILDVHNYARYGSLVIGPGVSNAQFADLWTRLANKYKTNDKVVSNLATLFTILPTLKFVLQMFGLMNEPKEMKNVDWKNGAQAAVNAIRATGATNYILLPGNGWTGAHSWLQNWYDEGSPKTTNAETMIQVTDSANKMIFEVHQYFDNGYSGTQSECLAPTVGKDKLVEFTNWLRQNNRKGFLGEFGGSETQNCFQAIKDALQYMQDNSDVWVGWTYWAAGTAWPVDYIYSIQPKNNYQTDRPQLAYMLPFMSSGTPVSIPMAPVAPVAPVAAPPVASCTPGTSNNIYTDSLQSGWEDWSWAKTKNSADTSVKRTGTASFSFIPTNFEAIFFAKASGATYSTSSYSGVEFYINGAPSGGQQIRVGFRKSGDSEYGTPTYVNINNYIDGATSVGNVWRRVYVPFSAMNIGLGDTLMGVTIQADIANTQATVYLDDVRLICAGTSTPVATPVAAPVKPPTAVPVTVPIAAPVKAPTSVPVSAPVKAPTAVPVTVPVAAPVKPPTSVTPIAAPVAAPVKAPTASMPVAAPVAAPVRVPTANPVASPTNSGSAPASTPISTPIDDNVPISTDVPVADDTPVPATTTAPASVPVAAGKTPVISSLTSSASVLLYPMILFCIYITYLL